MFLFGVVGSNIPTALAQVLINYANDLGIFQYSTDISGNTTLVNQGTGDDGLLNTGRAIELVNGVNDVTISGDYITWFDFADNQFHSATTSKTFTGITTNSILTHKMSFDAPSLANLNANPQLIAELGINGSSSELNVTLDATDAFYACSEESLGTIYDTRSVNSQTITNYAETVRTNVNQNPAGLQTTCMELDGAGVPIAYDLTKLWFYGDGFIDTQWTPSENESFTVHVGTNIEADTSIATQTLIGGGRTRFQYRSDIDRLYGYFFNSYIQLNSPITNTDVYFSFVYDAVNKNIYMYQNSVLVYSLTITPSALPSSMYLGAKNLGDIPYEHYIGEHDMVSIETEYTEQAGITEAYNTWLANQ